MSSRATAVIGVLGGETLTPVGTGPGPANQTFAERVATIQGQGVTIHRWGRSVNTSGTTYTMEVGANGTIVNPVTDDYDQGELLVDSGGGSSIGLSGSFPDPTRISIATVEQAAREITLFVQIDQVQTGSRVIYWENNGADLAGATECRVTNDGANGLRFEIRIADSANARVIKLGTSLAQVPVREPVMLSYLINNSDLRAFVNGVEASLVLSEGTLSAWTAPAAGESQIGASLFDGASSGGIDCVLGEFLVTSPLSAVQRAYLAEHELGTVVAARNFAGTVDEGSSAATFSSLQVTHPTGGALSIVTPPSLGSATTALDTIIYTPPATVSEDTTDPLTYRHTFGGQTADAVFTPTVTNSVVSSELPEDAALPSASATLNATTSNFNTVYASASAGDHIILANGNYGAKTLSRSFAANNRIVIRAQNLHGATFTTLTISGNGHIVSGVTVDRGSTTETGATLILNGSNIRVTRSIIRNGGEAVLWGAGSADTLVDHCHISRWRDRGFNLADPKSAVRMTIARCWVHDMLLGGNLSSNHCYAFADELLYRSKQIHAVVRLNYNGPGIPSGVSSDYIHNKVSRVCFAFNYWDVGNDLLSQRTGLRSRYVGNYAPNARLNAYDDLGWYYGNYFGGTNGWMRFPAGNYAYYDETKALGADGSVPGGLFKAALRTRIAGNQAMRTTLGYDFGNSWCTQSSHEIFPDVQPAGVAKPQRVYQGVTYSALPAGDGITIRAHSGTIDIDTGLPCLASQAVNVSSQPGSAASATWLSELLTEYPWIEGICPNPTSLTGGPGGSAPWSIAQGLTRGDAATPNTGPFRNSPGGLP